MPADHAEWIKVSEAAHLLGVSRSTVYLWFDKGVLEGRHYLTCRTARGRTGTVRISRASVDDLIREATPRRKAKIAQLA